MKRKNEKYILKCMCPPKEISYFFTFKGVPLPLKDKHREIKKNANPNLKVIFFYWLN